MISKTVTLKDVAVHAGVSPRTVSNVVNDYPFVSDAMRTRVQASLEALGYRPNLLARSLRQGRTGIITLLVPDIEAPYFGELAHEVVEQAGELGYVVLIDETGGDPVRERALLASAAESNWVDGVLLSSLGLSGRDLAGYGSRVTVVLLGERTADSVLDHVGIDNVSAAFEAVRHLLDAGRVRVAAIGGHADPGDVTSHLRLRGYRQALEEAGLGPGWHVVTDDYHRSMGAAAVTSLLQRPERPDALFCVSDDLAVGAMRALHDAGLRIPDDVAVVGFDDVDVSRYLVPSLTSIRPDRAGIAAAALRVLLERLAGGQQPPREVHAAHELVVRESSGSGTA